VHKLGWNNSKNDGASYMRIGNMPEHTWFSSSDMGEKRNRNQSFTAPYEMYRKKHKLPFIFTVFSLANRRMT
jgi:hypothetical protein